jgi:hypothetical protein
MLMPDRPISKRIHDSGMNSESMMAGTPKKCVALLRASWWYAGIETHLVFDGSHKPTIIQCF